MLFLSNRLSLSTWFAEITNNTGIVKDKAIVLLHSEFIV